MHYLTEAAAAAATRIPPAFRLWAETTASLLIWCALGGAMFTFPAAIIYWAVNGS